MTKIIKERQTFKTQTLKGFRDFLPEEKRKRDYVIAKIKETFELFGFEPLETPTLEYAPLLLGKYGKEVDKLIYQFKDRGGREVALKYDQTVPTARVLAQYQKQLPQFFRRYQVQNVFRADKPQKGRYREFTQCDIDIFGSTSPLADAEILACTYFAFKNIGFKNVVLWINDRQTITERAKPFIKGITVSSFLQTFDKLDKISEQKVLNELSYKGLAIKDAQEAIKAIKSASVSQNLQKILEYANKLGVPQQTIKVINNLARGLDYYTGMIFEVKIPEYGINSLAGGGRYDDLIKKLCDVDIPAVGVAFGFDRIVEAANQLALIPQIKTASKSLVTIFSPEYQLQSIKVASLIRQSGVNCELYLDPEKKLDKQIKYADKKGIPYVIILGSEEIKTNTVTLKNLKTRTQKEKIPLNEAIKIILRSNACIKVL